MCFKHRMERPEDALLNALSLAELRDLIGRLAGQINRLRAENQALKDEIARFKGLPPRAPKTTPSGRARPRGVAATRAWLHTGAADHHAAGGVAGRGAGGLALQGL